MVVYERFTSDARKALVAGQLVARAAGAEATGASHLLVALAEADAWVADLLVGLGVTADRLRARIPSGPGSPDVMPLAADGRAALEAASLEAERLQREAIGAEHVLLGILDVGGAATGLLLGLGHDPQSVRRALLSVGPGIDPSLPGLGAKPAPRYDVDPGPRFQLDGEPPEPEPPPEPILRIAPPIPVDEAPDLGPAGRTGAPPLPRCPGCRGDLTDAVRHVRVPVDIEVTVDLVHCGRCGHTLTTRVVERG